MSTARSLWFVGPRHVELRPVPLPACADGEVLVETAFSGVSTGTELLAYRGLLDPDMAVDETIGALGGTFRFPFRYGYSCVGHVVETRGDLSVGDLVFAFHPHQDRFVARAADLVRLPPIDPRLATLLPFVETAFQLSLDAGAVFADTVVVSGLGVVGLLLSVLLQRAGARPLGVEPRAWRRRVASELGAHAVAPEDAAAALAAAGHADGVPLVIEVSGNPRALDSCLQLLAFEGTALVGSWYGDQDVVLALGDRFHRRRLSIRSSQVSTIPAVLSPRWDRRRRLETVNRMLTTLPLDALATHTVGFDDAASGYAALDEGRDGLLHLALGYSATHVPGRHGDRVPRPAHHAGDGRPGG